MPRVSAEQRRLDFVAVALDLLVEEGPAAITARRIADRAGASLGTVHYAFRDMDELHQLAAAELLGRVNVALAAVRTDAGVAVAVEDVLTAWWRWVRGSEGAALAFAETLVALIRSGNSAGTSGAAHSLVLELLRRAAEHDTEPSRIPLPQLANLILMAADGLGLVHLARGDSRQTARDLKAMIAALQSLV
ncbi:MAG: TetR/AcrR family transcriptional regulator [Sporichthyaceae bacterium]